MLTVSREWVSIVAQALKLAQKHDVVEEKHGNGDEECSDIRHQVAEIQIILLPSIGNDIFRHRVNESLFRVIVLRHTVINHIQKARHPMPVGFFGHLVRQVEGKR